MTNSAHAAFCLGGPLDGKWKPITGDVIKWNYYPVRSLADLPKITEKFEPTAMVESQVFTYELSHFVCGGKSFMFYKPHGKTDIWVMERLIMYYEILTEAPL